MKSSEQLVAAIRELRFPIDRLTAADLAEAQPAVRQALEAQAKALQADVERLAEELAAVGPADALERDLIT
jgi:histidinol-phosphate/aromatic aminotransferase/cobyric acid decarboxylase-like protein